MPDERLPIPVYDLVPADRVRNYPINFRSISESDLYALSLRREQLTSSLLALLPRPVIFSRVAETTMANR